MADTSRLVRAPLMQQITQKRNVFITRWKLTIEYKGMDYYGWQTQPDLPTIQRAVEDALYEFCQQRIRLYAAGRTDAGVHAIAQIAHFDLDYGERDLDGYVLTKALNAHLVPQAISIIHAEKVAPDFHARFSAINKFYRYRIINRVGFIALERDYVWHIRQKLDVKAMQAAAPILLGQHDFSSFRAAECQAKSPIKQIDRLDIIRTDYDSYDGSAITIEAEGPSFLHHQVRNIVGSLTLVGKGRWSCDDLQSALNAKDRAAGGPTAPPQGLCLMNVDYA